MIKGNIGEWSELYVLLKLLADGKLYSADKDLNKIPDLYSPILRIFRHEAEKMDLEYKLTDKKHTVELYINGDKIKTIEGEWLVNAAQSVYSGMISNENKSAFSIDSSEEILDKLEIEKIKAPSTDKTDIKVQMHDTHTGHDTIVGFSIKSDIGAPPTLLNPSRHTNFIYEVSGISDDLMHKINEIDTSTKIIDRVSAIQDTGKISYVQMDSEIFEHNVTYIDSMMDDILSALLLINYIRKITDISQIVTIIEEEDPLGYKKPGMYRYKIKKFLAAIALGMVPGTVWDGRDEANGGYIIVKKDGDVVAYHIYNRDNFENYLLNNTRVDRASTTRYRYAEIYKDGDKKFIKLNLQVRFKS